jgi:hypothetical protein
MRSIRYKRGQLPELYIGLEDLKCAAAAICAEHIHLADGSVAEIMTELNKGRRLFLLSQSRPQVFQASENNHALISRSPHCLPSIRLLEGVGLTCATLRPSCSPWL